MAKFAICTHIVSHNDNGIVPMANVRHGTFANLHGNLGCAIFVALVRQFATNLVPVFKGNRAKGRVTRPISKYLVLTSCFAWPGMGRGCGNLL